MQKVHSSMKGIPLITLSFVKFTDILHPSLAQTHPTALCFRTLIIHEIWGFCGHDSEDFCLLGW